MTNLYTDLYLARLKREEDKMTYDPFGPGKDFNHFEGIGADAYDNPEDDFQGKRDELNLTFGLNLTPAGSLPFIKKLRRSYAR